MISKKWNVSHFILSAIFITIFSFIVIKANSALYTRQSFNTYTFSDHRYKITFEYPESFTPPTENYYATTNIIQNRFQNDQGVDFMFMSVDLGDYRDLHICQYDEADNFCIRDQDNSGYVDPDLHLHYFLNIQYEGTDSKLDAALKHAEQSFLIEDTFNNTENWVDIDFDEVFKLKYPPGINVVQDYGNSINLSDAHRYNIHVSVLSEYDLGQEYQIWKEGYLGTSESQYPSTRKLDFIKTSKGTDVISVQAIFYVDGLIYKITSGPLTDVRYDDGKKIASDITVLKDVYLKPGSDAYKYLEYVKKVTELAEVNSSNVDKVKSRLEEEKMSVASSQMDTSDWLIYKNDEYGFSFKYPNDLEVEVRKDGRHFRMFILNTELAYDYDFMALEFGALDSLTIEDWFKKTVDLNDVLSYKTGTTTQGYKTLTLEGVRGVENLRGYWLISSFIEDGINMRSLGVFGPLNFYPLKILEPYQPRLLNNIIDSIHFYKVN